MNTIAMVPTPVDCQCQKRTGTRPQRRCKKYEETHTASGEVGHVRPDHDNARYLVIHPHYRDVLLKPRQEKLECHSEEFAVFIVVVGA